MILKITALCLAILALPTISNAQSCNQQITGHVIDKDVNENLSGAVVYIASLNKKIVTDKKGNFVFTNICNGEYTIEVSHVSCQNFTKKIVINNTPNTHLDIEMPHSITTLGAATVVGRKELQNTGFKKELSGLALEATKGTSLAQALSNINGVTMLQTGATVAKPVVHGLSGNRLLLINNGVRLEGQQWGNEHAPEVDPFLADQLTVIKGVDELKYGSDAIGGVILVAPKPLRLKAGKSLEVNTGYFTNNKLYYGSAIWEQQLPKLPALTYRLQGTYKRSANSTTPNYRLNNTGLQEANFSGTLRYKKEHWNTELFYSFFATKLGIFSGSHIGNTTDLLTAIAAPQPDPNFTDQQTYTILRPRQEVTHQTIKLKNSYTVGKQKINALVAAQFNNRREYDIVRVSTNTSPQINLQINTLAEDINWDYASKKNTTGTIGINATQQQNTYTGRYLIPNYTAYTTGAYATNKYTNHQWELQTGIRFDAKTITTKRLKINNNFSSYTFNYNTGAASANVIYKATNNLKTNVNIALSTRAPYVNELLSDGIHHGTATYEKGELSLKPEQSLYTSWNTTYTSNNDKLHIEALLYTNRINNFIYQQPLPNEPVLTIAGAFPQIKYVQTNATLYGSDITTDITLHRNVQLNTKYSVLYGRNNTTNDWLIYMPNTRVSNEVVWALPQNKTFANSHLTAKWLLVAEQKRVPTKGNSVQDYKAPPSSYGLLQLGYNTTLTNSKCPLTLFVGIENATNKVYREYTNSFRYYSDEVGRNFTLRLKIPIQL